MNWGRFSIANVEKLHALSNFRRNIDIAILDSAILDGVLIEFVDKVTNCDIFWAALDGQISHMN